MSTQLFEKLNRELAEVKESAAFAPFTMEQLSDCAYRISMMQLCIEAVEYMEESGMEEEKADWLLQMERPLDYLYHIWLESDYSFAPSLAELLLAGIDYDMEVAV